MDLAADSWFLQPQGNPQQSQVAPGTPGFFCLQFAPPLATTAMKNKFNELEATDSEEEGGPGAQNAAQSWDSLDVDLEVGAIEDLEQFKSELAEICRLVPAKGRWRSQNRSRRGRKKDARDFDQLLKELEVPAAAEGLSVNVSSSVALESMAVPPPPQPFRSTIRLPPSLGDGRAAKSAV